MHSEHVVVHALPQHDLQMKLQGSPHTKVAHCRMPTAFTACTGNSSTDSSESSSGEVGPKPGEGLEPRSGEPGP